MLNIAEDKMVLIARLVIFEFVNTGNFDQEKYDQVNSIKDLLLNTMQEMHREGLIEGVGFSYDGSGNITASELLGATAEITTKGEEYYNYLIQYLNKA